MNRIPAIRRLPSRVIGVAALFFSTASVAAAQAGSGDSAAVVAVAQRLLTAIGKRDTALARSVLVTGSQLISSRQDGAIRRQSDTAFIRMLATGQQRYLERMWSPRVRVEGGIADVWAPYDFHIDGRFSHCGVDTFTLLRSASGWQIVSIVYTVQPTGCAPSPLGPP